MLLAQLGPQLAQGVGHLPAAPLQLAGLGRAGLSQPQLVQAALQLALQLHSLQAKRHLTTLKVKHKTLNLTIRTCGKMNGLGSCSVQVSTAL